MTSLPHSGKPFSIFYYDLSAQERIHGQHQTDNAHLHIDEDVWVQKPQIILSRIKSKLGLARKIHARQTVVARINKAQAMQFQEDYHLQGALPGKYRYGLFLGGELVSVAVFSGGRRMRTYTEDEDLRSFELLRFCHKNGLAVVGGLSKLLRSFAKDFEPGDIMTYVDRDWTDGASFERLGFEIAGETLPQEFWVDANTSKRYTAFAAGNTGGLVLKTNSGSLKMVKRLHPPFRHSSSVHS